MRTIKVINGKICIEALGAKAWFSRDHIERLIAKIEKDLEEWKSRLELLDKDDEE